MRPRRIPIALSDRQQREVVQHGDVFRVADQAFLKHRQRLLAFPSRGVDDGREEIGANIFGLERCGLGELLAEARLRCRASTAPDRRRISSSAFLRTTAASSAETHCLFSRTIFFADEFFELPDARRGFGPFGVRGLRIVVEATGRPRSLRRADRQRSAVRRTLASRGESVCRACDNFTYVDRRHSVVPAALRCRVRPWIFNWTTVARLHADSSASIVKAPTAADHFRTSAPDAVNGQCRSARSRTRDQKREFVIEDLFTIRGAETTAGSKFKHGMNELQNGRHLTSVRTWGARNVERRCGMAYGGIQPGTCTNPQSVEFVRFRNPNQWQTSVRRPRLWGMCLMPKPTCPNCGGNDVTLWIPPGTDPARIVEKHAAMVYDCKCGTAFTATTGRPSMLFNDDRDSGEKRNATAANQPD